MNQKLKSPDEKNIAFLSSKKAQIISLFDNIGEHLKKRVLTLQFGQIFHQIRVEIVRIQLFRKNDHRFHLKFPF